MQTPPEELISFFGTITDSPFWHVFTSVVTLAAAVAAMTPNRYDNKVVQGIRFFIDLLAFNFKNAKNAK